MFALNTGHKLTDTSNKAGQSDAAQQGPYNLFTAPVIRARWEFDISDMQLS